MIVKIEKLRVRTEIGVYEQEKGILQELLLSAEIEIDARDVLQSGNLEDTLDYDSLCKRWIHTIENRSFDLIETVADIAADLVLKEEKVLRVRLEVAKPKALAFADSVSVTLEKSR